jgi:hypothetical protein
MGTMSHFSRSVSGCKVPQAQLLKYLELIEGDKIGMDCSIMPTKFKDIVQVSTTDFFYPLVDVRERIHFSGWYH